MISAPERGGVRRVEPENRDSCRQGSGHAFGAALVMSTPLSGSCLPAVSAVAAHDPPLQLPLPAWGGTVRHPRGCAPLHQVGREASLVPELMRRAPAGFGATTSPSRSRRALLDSRTTSRSVARAGEGWAVPSDTNLRLVRTYRAVRDDVEGLIALRDYAECHDKDQYEIRSPKVDAMEDTPTSPRGSSTSTRPSTARIG